MGGALSSQAEGGFLMVEYHKSSAAFSLTAQLLVRMKLLLRVKLGCAITAVRSLGEDGLGGQRFLVPQHEAPAQSILPQRAQQKPKKKAANPKINGFLNLAGGIGEIRTLDKALHPILP